MLLVPATDPTAVHYLPLFTTALAAVFASVLLAHYRRTAGLHVLWWGIGVLCYGLGTALESAITLFGNAALLNKAWYAAGALLGAYPLAQGTVYLLLGRLAGHRLTRATLPVVGTLAVLVLLSPVDADALEPHRPGGAALGWSWLRLCTPLVNLYAAGFLVGGAALSAWRYARRGGAGSLAAGNALIASGALLPAIGGGLAKAGTVEALYVGELVGLVLIWAGYRTCRRPVRR